MAEINVTETNQRRTQARILDVREDAGVASGMISGALHIPMSKIPTRVDELEPSTPVIVVCRSGNRSAHVADALTAAGFAADTMTGGMLAWAKAGLPTT